LLSKGKEGILIATHFIKFESTSHYPNTSISKIANLLHHIAKYQYKNLYLTELLYYDDRSNKILTQVCSNTTEATSYFQKTLEEIKKGIFQAQDEISVCNNCSFSEICRFKNVKKVYF